MLILQRLVKVQNGHPKAPLERLILPNYRLAITAHHRNWIRLLTRTRLRTLPRAFGNGPRKVSGKALCLFP